MRIALDEIERVLNGSGAKGYVSGNDKGIVIFLRDDRRASEVRTTIAQNFSLPERVVRVCSLPDVPLLMTGKVDYRELARRADTFLETVDQSPKPEDFIYFVSSVLRQPDVDPNRSFREIGGDSLAYLEVELFLARRGGGAPDGWDRMPLREVARRSESRSGTKPVWRDLHSDVFMRVLAILAVVTLHSTHIKVSGGSYILLILSGYSLAKFQSANLLEGRVVKVLTTMLVPILVIYYSIVIPLSFLIQPFDWQWLALLGNMFSENGSGNPRFLRPYWYVSTYTQVTLLISIPFVFRPIRAVIGRNLFMAALLALVAVAVTMEVMAIGDIAHGLRHRHQIGALELSLLGWCIALADTAGRKILMSVIIFTVFGFGWQDVDMSIAIFLLVGSIAVLWSVRLPVPRQLVPVFLLLGSLSLYIYLMHVPVLYIARDLLDSSAAIFGFTLVGSIGAAYVTKLVYDRIVGLVFRPTFASKIHDDAKKVE